MAGRANAPEEPFDQGNWHPPGRRFWITPEMIAEGKKGEPKPWFSTHTVATVFIGRSAAWLRVKMRQSDDFPDSQLVLDGKALDIHRSPTGDRQFSLRDIEMTAHALHESGAIDDKRFACMIMLAVWSARQNNLPVDEES